jgi:transposase-like protein
VERLRDDKPVALGALIHDCVREAVEQLVQEELAVALGALKYQRSDERSGYRKGARRRTLTAQSGPFTMRVPRGVLVDGDGKTREWRSRLLPRYQRRLPEINEAVASVYLSGANTRGLATPRLCVVDGCPGLRSAIDLVWAKTVVQRCAVHKLRNLERKVPRHALDEMKSDYHRIVYAGDLVAARAAYKDFVAAWQKRCPAVVRSLDEAGDELLTFYRFPKSQWKTLRTTNVIERLNGEFRRRVTTQASLPTEDAALVLLFSLVASGHVKLRRVDGWQDIARVLSETVRQLENRAA